MQPDKWGEDEGSTDRDWRHRWSVGKWYILQVVRNADEGTLEASLLTRRERWRAESLTRDERRPNGEKQTGFSWSTSCLIKEDSYSNRKNLKKENS
jgi:hypothetical protein